ncbi:DUF7282 domain-containing protein [Halosimplex marinum]|uniref:DUF7282 domain-containing protein n=1 Tax=Halosimplex marinum TaxID=3396620 RepID=UPI003F542AEF
MSAATSRRFGVLLALAVVLSTPLAVATVGAHGDHVRADSQVSDDGTVLVETVSSIRPGFVVLRADAGGRPGDPIGSTYVGRTPAQTYRKTVAVSVDPTAWGEWGGNRTVWAVLHADADGDGEFDPGTDRSVTAANPAASTQITVRKSDAGPARVLAAAFDPQELDDGALTVRRADLPAAGHLVVRPAGSNRTVGTRSLAAGTHRNVTVALNESFLDERTRDFRVRVAAYRDDGDGVFGPDDAPITAGDRVVDTYLAVAHDDASTDRPLVVTPAPTTVGSPTAAATGTAPPATDSPDRATTAADPPAATGATTATDGSGAGFGVAAALLAVLVGALAVGVRSRRRG